MYRFAFVIASFFLGPIARAQPEPTKSAPLELKSGKVALPLSGLQLDLPAQGKGHTYKVNASYSLDAGFDARDVIDETKDGQLVGGTWVLAGYFTAGACKDVIARPDLGAAWEGSVTLHDVPFAVRGGIFTFDGSLGQVPTAVLCAERPKLEPGTRKALVLYHYFIGTPLSTGRDELLALLPKRPAVERTAKSWKQDLVAKTSLSAPNVRLRGEKPAPKTLELPVADLSIAPPDDGTLWVVRSSPDEGVDWLDRMIPALPEASVEVVHSSESCTATLALVTGARMKNVPAPRHVPSGWSAGPVLDIGGDPEYTVCRDFKEGSLLVGYFLDKAFTKDQGDLRPIHALLASLAAAKP